MGCASSTPPVYKATGEPLQKTICGDLIQGVNAQKNVVLLKRFSSLAKVMYESPEEEIKTMQLIQQHPHPNLIGLCVSQPVKSEDFRFIAVMDYSQLGDLHKHITRLNREGKMIGAKLAKQFGKQILQGVNHLHKMHRSHGDISCENMLLFQSKGKLLVKLIDYGFSRDLMQPAPPRSMDGHVYGKPAYLAPELLNPTNPYDPVKVDVFAIGVCLYAMIAGNFPFDSTDIKNPQWVHFMRNGLFAHNHALGVTMSSSATHLLSLMLHPNPKKRITVEQALKHHWVN